MPSLFSRPAYCALLLCALLTTAAAAAADAHVLFDGKSLDQFDVRTCTAVVQDGAILLKAGNGLVQTKKQYTDFTFRCEWETLESDRWDSGIYFRYTTIPKGRAWPDKYQVNLRKGMEGDLVGFKKAVNAVPVNLHGWNRFELTVKGATAALKVNGKPAWQTDGIETRRGYIALQAEVPGGGQFLFRDIRITELKPAGKE
jgi:hypothetical protein